MASPAAQYLAQYEGYTLPGYVQSESFDSTINVASHEAPYADGGLLENVGIQNKSLSLKMRVWDEDYAACKAQVERAATILRSKRQGTGMLRVMYSDRYYEAMPKSIKMEKQAGSSVKIVDYDIDFDAKPWLVSDAVYTVSGDGLNGARTTFSTVGRTIDDGGWTYATVKLSGREVTVSGYTQSGDLAGFISVSGYIANLVIDSEAFTATVAGVNQNKAMKSVDYRMYVGPEVTYFTVSGAQLCEITYHNRWYI